MIKKQLKLKLKKRGVGMKACKWCGKEFESYHCACKYCCKECAKKAHKRQMADWQVLHREERAKSGKRRYNEKKIKKKCRTCGVELPNNSQKWCLDCLLKEYIKSIGTSQEHQRITVILASRGYNKEMIMNEIEERKIKK